MRLPVNYMPRLAAPEGGASGIASGGGGALTVSATGGGGGGGGHTIGGALSQNGLVGIDHNWSKVAAAATTRLDFAHAQLPVLPPAVPTAAVNAATVPQTPAAATAAAGDAGDAIAAKHQHQRYEQPPAAEPKPVTYGRKTGVAAAGSGKALRPAAAAEDGRSTTADGQPLAEDPAAEQAVWLPDVDSNFIDTGQQLAQRQRQRQQQTPAAKNSSAPALVDAASPATPTTVSAGGQPAALPADNDDGDSGSGNAKVVTVNSVKGLELNLLNASMWLTLDTFMGNC